MTTEIRPQPGAQERFLATKADIAIYGGQAGSGKTYAILLENLRYIDRPDIPSMVFRKNTTHIRIAGGLWQESQGLYRQLGGEPKGTTLEWVFPSGKTIRFWYLERDEQVFDYQGAQIPVLMFDELTHFSEYQFFYMLSRNRSASGIRPYVRATCNPDSDSWLRTFIDWWIDPLTGLAIQERSGVLRWFARHGDQMVWANTRKELRALGFDTPKSVTFIPASLSDNKILMEKDPGYVANLKAMSRVDRERLLYGNWNITYAAGELFKKGWFPVIDAVPSDIEYSVRFWDRAATEPHEGNKDPDWTRGCLIHKHKNGAYTVADVASLRGTPLQVERLIKNTASQDTVRTMVRFQIDPGSAGVKESDDLVRILDRFDARAVRIATDKVTRAKACSAQSEAGNVRILRAPWNDEFFSELESFPKGKHDDIVDSLTGAYNDAASVYSIF